MAVAQKVSKDFGGHGVLLCTWCDRPLVEHSIAVPCPEIPDRDFLRWGKPARRRGRVTDAEARRNTR